MSLKDLALKDFYDSSDNVYEDFFNKVLTESVKCSRFGGKFSSINFARCAEGMKKFIMSYSTGKDSALALQRMINNGYECVGMIISFNYHLLF